MPDLRAHGSVGPTVLARLAPLVRAQHTLADVVAWMAAAGGRPSIVHVVEQDEYTQDVVIRESEGVFLVYDCT